MLVSCVVFNTLIILNGSDIQGNIVYGAALMFSPALIALGVTFAYDRNLRGFDWKWQNTKFQLLGYILPIIYITIAYGLVIVFGFDKLDIDNIARLDWLQLLMTPTLGITGVLLLVLGEGFIAYIILQMRCYNKKHGAWRSW